MHTIQVEGGHLRDADGVGLQLTSYRFENPESLRAADVLGIAPRLS